jgi:putative Mn2+ efflux pump MntP
MNIWLVFLLACGLAFDAFTVAVTCGTSAKSLLFGSALKVALFFGFFQAIMPVLGWFVGNSLKELLTAFDHWIAFALLFLVGVRMISESFKKREKRKVDLLHPFILLILALATSIDALAVGLSLSFIGVRIIIPIVIIGTVTFVLSLFGFLIGVKIGSFFGRKLESLGGIILIGIGIYIVITHVR